ncbi:hypothetical protein [Streptomyces sp. NPDC004726]
MSLELPEGTADDRPPFALVIDQASGDETRLEELRRDIGDTDIAARIGARAVLVFEETIDIPANEVLAGPNGYPVRLAVEADLSQFYEQLAEAHGAAARFTHAAPSVNAPMGTGNATSARYESAQQQKDPTGRTRPPNRATGAVIEIIETGRATDGTTGGSVLVPNDIRINGQSRLASADDPVTVHEVSTRSDDLVRVTLTLFARRVSIRAENDPT